MAKLLPTILFLSALSYGCSGCDRQDPLDNTDTDAPDKQVSDVGLQDVSGYSDVAQADVDGLRDGGRTGSADATGADAPDATSTPDSESDLRSESDIPSTSVCGNGDVEADEVCDDGNQASGDYCAADCSAATGTCGDGVLQSNETCDDSLTTDCASSRDGGDGACVAAGTCSAGFIDGGSACVPELLQQHVHIYVANDCTMMVDPPEFNVPRGQKVQFAWHNHSQFYPVDVWQSYIGGYTDLPTGATWNEQFEWCANVNPYVGYSDITTNQACPSHRFFITCNGR